jgi:hypothetical protein
MDVFLIQYSKHFIGFVFMFAQFANTWPISTPKVCTFLTTAIDYPIPNLNVAYYMSLTIDRGYICCIPNLKLEASEC